MSNHANFFNLCDLSGGIARELAQGLSTRIFVGEHAMLSIVDVEPNARGEIHSHPEEQWGMLLVGDGVRIQNGQRIPVRVGDFWRTPPGVSHGFEAGDDGARLLDIFSPPRDEYRAEGLGFGGDQ